MHNTHSNPHHPLLVEGAGMFPNEKSKMKKLKMKNEEEGFQATLYREQHR